MIFSGFVTNFSNPRKISVRWSSTAIQCPTRRTSVRTVSASIQGRVYSNILTCVVLQDDTKRFLSTEGS